MTQAQQSQPQLQIDVNDLLNSYRSKLGSLTATTTEQEVVIAAQSKRISELEAKLAAAETAATLAGRTDGAVVAE